MHATYLFGSHWRTYLSTAVLLVTSVCIALALALLPLQLAGGLVVGSTLLILSLIDPIWALYAAVLAVPVQEQVLLPGGVSFVQAALLLAAASWVLHLCAHPEHFVLMGRVFVGLVAVVCALALSSTTTPYSQIESLKETLRWSTVVVIYLLALNRIAVDQHPYWRTWGLIACLLLSPVLTGLYGVWQFFTGTGPPGFSIAGDFVRAYGTIGQPNSFAGYMNMGWGLALALAVGAAWEFVAGIRQNTGHKSRPALWLLLIVGVAGGAALVLLAALFTSLSRGGWVGAVGGLVSMFIALAVIAEQRIRTYLWQLAGVTAIGVLLLAIGGDAGLLPEAISGRISSIINNLQLFDVRIAQVTPENFAVVERMAHLQAAWEMFQDYPITGVGPGNYTPAFEGSSGFNSVPYTVAPWYVSRGHAHNYYLHIAAESGSIGLLAYLLLLILLIRQGWATLLHAHGWFWRSIALGGYGIITTVAVHNIFENLHVLNMGVQLGAVWGLLAAIESRKPEIREGR